MLKLPKGILAHPKVAEIEAASSSLNREKHGLELLVTKEGQTQNPRLSRFLMLSNDGSERFYHDAESLLLQYTGRLLGCVLDAKSEELGAVLLPPQKIAKAVMIDDRKALEQFLLALVV